MTQSPPNMNISQIFAIGVIVLHTKIETVSYGSKVKVPYQLSPNSLGLGNVHHPLCHRGRIQSLSLGSTPGKLSVPSATSSAPTKHPPTVVVRTRGASPKIIRLEKENTKPSQTANAASNFQEEKLVQSSPILTGQRNLRDLNF